jgi:glutamate synthase (NADPH/NADH) small chain
MTEKSKKTIEDFPLLKEMTPPMRPEEARIEAERCLYCYDSPCTVACPSHIDIPRFIKQIASKDTLGSAETILEANPLGHSCARVCPVEALCEGDCVYLDWHEAPIQIGRLQRYATDYLFAEGLQPFEAGKNNGKKVGIVGAGPAGLSCAAYLRRLGFAVTVFERKPKPGGLNTYGMAEYKMDQKTALDETALVLDLGVDIRYGTTLGEDLKIETLEKDFDAVFLGVGLGATSSLGVPGEDLKGVYEALHFIEYIKNHEFDKIPAGETTVCIGAGNTAVDVVTQAKRIGTPKVVMAYRRGRDQMPAYDYEYDLAAGDAVQFDWFSMPVEILGEDRVTGIRLRKTKVEDGKVVPVEGSDYEIPCDRVVKAIGQSKQVDLLSKDAGIALDAKGRIKVDEETLATSNERIFAGGDAVNGGKEIVNASAHGKRAALGIFRFLFPGEEPGPEHRDWIQTIEGVRAVRPPNHHHDKKELVGV